MRYLKSLIRAALAGASIALGGAAYLSCESKAVGAVFFTVGLFAVCTMGFDLFTGKVCYALERDRRYALALPVIWLGNFLGAWGAAALLGLTRLGPVLRERAAALSQAKLDDGPVSLFVLAVFCNVLIYLAVEGFQKNPHEVGKYLSLFLGVTVFVLCGFEHCVADMFYFSMAGVWGGQALADLLLISAGNALGGVLVPAARRWVDKGES